VLRSWPKRDEPRAAILRVNAGRNRSNPDRIETAVKRVFLDDALSIYESRYIVKTKRGPFFAGNAAKVAVGRRVSLALNPAHAAFNTVRAKARQENFSRRRRFRLRGGGQCVFLDSALFIGDSRYSVNQKVLLQPSIASTWSFRAWKSAPGTRS
jgi:hypothetical protein